ncbi:MAG: Fur family transcriptional regulator [Eubacteriales bacterium]|jgi:Fur family ferric uptake transcriptional regulator
MTSISEELRKQGLKSTKHRLEILEVLRKGQKPYTAEQIFTELLDRNVNINFSTVYRTLDILCGKQLVTKLNIEGTGGAMFEYNTTDHRHHLICLGCRKITAIDYCPLGNYETSLEKKTNYIISGHKLDVYGYCPDCKKDGE